MKWDKHKIILGLIILSAAFLRLFRLGRADMSSDGAINSFRSIGYLDFLASQLQTTPLHWFPSLPWWSYLSFHDGPPLCFLIQHFFFKIFGVTTVVARLPYALLGIGSVWLVYFLTKKLYGQKCAYLAGFLLAICNYHIWASRITYLEGILIFFMLLAVYYFIKALEKDNYFIHFGLFLGLAFLCKYTAFFLAPAFITYLLLAKREVLKNKKLWLGFLITLIVFSPVVIYNLEMYQSRGHFDLQFSGLFNQETEDWRTLSKGVGDYWSHFLGTMHTLKNALSPLSFYLFAASLILIFIETIFSKRRSLHLLILLLLFFLTGLFVLISGGVRFQSLYTPFVAIAISYFLVRIASILHQKKKYIQKYIYTALLVPFFIYLIFFAVNTNLLYSPIGKTGLAYSDIRVENWGYEQLENFLAEKIPLFNLSYQQKFTTFADVMIFDNYELQPNPHNPKLCIVYDSDINWFTKMWYFDKHIVYQKIPMVSTDGLAELSQIFEGDFLREWGFRDFYFIRTTDKTLLDLPRNLSDTAEFYENNITKNLEKLSPFRIKNNQGETAFKVYHFSFE